MSRNDICRKARLGACAPMDFTFPARTAISTAIAAALGITPNLVFANTITPDGRTATVVDVSGTLTNITTGTVRGANAFNSFRDFQITSGNTVNLRLPGGTDNLINLVTDSRAVIDGTLNSIKAGQIGGNVVFADPHGIVVGASGVVNVGSLMLTAPSAAFMDQLMDAEGAIDDAAVQRLLAGEAPLSGAPEGVIEINGTINAFGAVAIEGRGVVLTGNVRAGTDDAHQALFNAAVNTDGITAATDAAVIDGRVTIRAAEDVGVSGLVDASSAETGGSAGRVDISAGGDVSIDDTARVAAVGALDGGNGGRVEIKAAGNLDVYGAIDASATAFTSAGGTGNGGDVALQADQDLSVAGSASLAAAGAASGGDGGHIEIEADGTTSVSGAANLDASAGSTGNGGVIELTGAGNLTLDGLNADLAAGTGGADGELLIGNVNINVSGTEYYTNGGDVTINAGDTLTIETGTTINTRRIDGSLAAYEITPASALDNNPAGLANPRLADLFATASEGDSGNVMLQAPNITVESGARIYTFATDGFDAGDISLVSGDNFTCNICETRTPGDYFSSLKNVGNTLRVASTDDVSITVEAGAELDARYVDRAGYAGAAGQGGDVTLSATASDMQVAGYSQAGASILVNGALRGANVNVTASADAGVDFAWLASALDPANPTGNLELLQGIANVDAKNFHQNTIENADDWGDVTNILGVLGLPVTAGVAIADASVEIGDAAIVEAAGDVTIDAKATRTVLGATGGGLLSGSLPELGLSVIYGHVSGTTSALITGDAQITAGGALNVTATSENTMEVGSSAMVTQGKTGVKTKGNTTLAFSAGMGYVDVTTEAMVGRDVRIHDAGDVEVRATGVDKFTTEASSLAVTPTSGATAKAQGGITAAVSLWSTDVLAEFDARLADGVRIGSLDVIADNIAETHVTKTTVQTGNNFFDYLLGTPANRQAALSSLISGALGKTGGAGAPKFAAAASITVSEQSATARIGENAVVRADGDVTVRSRVVDQGIRSISDSRVNSTGPGAASLSGSVALAYGEYGHTSHAVIGDGAIVEAERIGVGARSELPIDNDYDEAFGDFNVTEWSGPDDFFTALNTIVGSVLAPDVPALESFGLADYLLTGYSNAYGDATQDGTAIFGSANALISTQDTRAWVGEGAQLTATGADGEWASEFSIDVEKADELDISTATEWTWSAPVDVDARTLTETIGVTGNLSLLTLITSANAPAGSSVGGSFGWNEFDNTTIAGIGDGAVVRAKALDVEATTTDRMIVIAPSAGQGKSMAGNGIFSLAQIGGTTHASIHHGAHIDADSIAITADHSVNLWAIGGAVAVSSGSSIAAAVAANSIETDTRAYFGDNSADRVLEDDEDTNGDGVADTSAADVAVADGSEAGVRTAGLAVNALSEGRVGAIGVAGAVARSDSSSSPPPAPKPKPTPATPTNNSFLGALKSAGGALNAGGSTPGGQSATLTGSGSGTLNFSRINTIAEIDGVTLLNDADAAAPDVRVSALTNIDQVSASGSAAVSIAGGGGGRSSAFAGAVAFNDIDNNTRAGIYGFKAPNGGSVGSVDVLAASSGDALSIAIALAAASGQSTVGAAGSVSIADISADTTAEIEDSELTADTADDTVSVTGYDRSRALVGGGALYLGLGGGSGGGVGLAATYGRIDNDVSAYVRGSTLAGFDTLDVSALGASRILAAAFGGSVSTGNSASGAGSLYIMTIDSDLASGITASYGTTTDADGDEVTDYDNVERRSDIDTRGDVTVTTASSAGVAELEGLFSTEGGFDSQADFGGDALAGIDTEQTGIDMGGTGAPGEAVIGIAGSLAISGGNAAAGMAIGFTDLQGSYTAEIRDADVTATMGDVDVSAINSRQAIGVAAGASVSGSGGPFTLLGSGAITLSDTKVSALVHGDSHITADHVDIAAGAQGSIFSLAGSLSASASGSAAIGAAATYNEIGGSVTARLGGDSVITDGSDPTGDARSVDVTADQDADIRSVAVAGAATGGSVAIGGSATINTITTDTSAMLDANAVTADTVRVAVRNGTLDDRAGVWSLAGSITASNTAGFGAAIAVNDLGGSYDALVSGTTFTGTDELTVHSSSASEIKTLAVSGGASGQVSAGVSNTTSVGDYTISAGLDDVDLRDDDARVDVYAGDDSTIDSLAGAVQIGGTAGVGAAVAVNDLGASVDAGISGGTLDVENVLLQARSRTDIDTIAVGIAGSGTASVSGSVAVNHVSSTTKALIDGGAVVEAANNVGVLAGSDDSVSIGAGSVAISGSVLGGAGSVTVNVLEGETEAAIRGASTRVEARGEDDDDTVAASGGELASTPSGNPFAELFGDGTGEIATPETEDFAGYSAPQLTGADQAATGVVVDAIALQQADTVVATAGVSADFVSGGTGVALAVNTTVLGGSARALIEDATIGDAAAPDANGDVSVAAGHHAYGTNVMLGLAAGSAGGVGTVSVDTYDGEATAAIRDADVHSGGAVDLDAVSKRDMLTVIAGLSVGTYGGVTGSGAVSVFSGETTAEITGDADIDADSVSLGADSETQQDLFIAGLAGSGGFGGSGALAVAISESDTTARIGDGDERTQVHSDGNVTLDADNSTQMTTLAASAAIGGGALSGAVGVQYIGNRTQASIDDAELHAGGGLDVKAADDITLDAIAGSAAIGGVAGGVGVNVGVIKSATVAEINDSDVTTGGAVTVDAVRNANLEVDTIVASASFGGAASVSGGVGVLLFGGSLDNQVHDDADGDLSDELGSGGGNWIGKADSFRSEDHLVTVDDDGNTVDRTGGAADRITEDPSTTTRFTSVQDGVYGVGDDGVAATISGGTLNAGTYQRTIDAGTADELVLEAGDRSVTVQAVDNIRTRNRAIAVSVGGAVSAGGGVAVTQVNSEVSAVADADQLRASTLNVKAASRNGLDDDGNVGDALRVAGYSGGAGLVGIGAAVSVGMLNGSVDASIGGDIDLRDGAEVVASDETTADVQALGASLGFAGAVGVAVAVADRDAEVNATVQSGTTLDVVGDDAAMLSGVDIRAEALGGADALAEAAAGGLFFAGSGAVAVSSDDRIVDASVGKNSFIRSGGDLTVMARALPNVSAIARGAAISYSASVGASVAKASSDTTLTAGIGDGSVLMLGRNDTGGTLTVSAEQHAPNSAGDWADGYDGEGVRAESVAVNGAVFLSANAAVADAIDRGSVSSRVGDGVVIYHQPNDDGDLPTGSKVIVEAQRESALLATTSGIVAGALAIGASVADADSDGSTDAYFGGGMGFQASGFRLDASSVTDVVADAISGSGGLIAGAAAEANVYDDADTTAELGGASLVRADEVDVLAHHQSRFRPAANSVQAAAVGFSGSLANADIDSTVITRVADAIDVANGAYARVFGYDVALVSDSDVSLGTHIDDAPDREYSVEGGAGGVLNGAAADSDITIDKSSRVEIGDGAYLRALNEPDATANSGLASLTLLANGSVNVNDRAYLGAGGAIQAPYASSEIDLTGSTQVSVGDSVQMMSEDLLGISAFETQVNASANAVTKTWGGVGFAGATTDTDVAYTQTVNVGDNSMLEGLGYTFVTAGRRADTVSTQAVSLFDVSAISDTYNYTALPLDTEIDAHASLDTDASVSLGSGSQVIAGWDVAIGGVKGERNVIGEGTGHNPYLELFSTETTQRDETMTGSTSLTLDGDVIAGFFNQWSFDVADDGGSVDVTLNGEALDPDRTAQNVAAYVDVIGGFDAQGYVEDLNDQVADLGETYQSFAEQVETAGLPSSIDVVRIHDVTATQGNVVVFGDSLAGSGSLEARGGASIAVTNASDAWLDVANLNVIDNIGGRVLFTGAIDGANTGGVTVNELNEGVSPAIGVVTSGNTGASSADGQPGLMISGPLYNQRGLVRLYNRTGNIYQGSVVQANQVQVVAPNGTYVIIAPDETIHAGGTPWSAWAGAEFSIGASDIIAYALRDYVENVRNVDLNSGSDLENYLYENWGTGTGTYDPGGDEDPYTVTYDVSLVPYNTGSLTGSSGGGSYVIFDDENRQAKFDSVPLKNFSHVSDYAAIDDTSLADGGIRANKVLILADVLDINAPIIAGQESDISIDLDSEIRTRIDDWRDTGSGDQLDLTWYHESGLYQDLPQFFRDLLGLPDISEASGEGWYALAPGEVIPFTADRTVSGFYDRNTQRIVMNGVQGATTGYISVDAQIVSTTKLGRLEVVNGYSDISVNNTTDLELVLNDVSTGTAETGVIEITDRLRDQRTWYVNRIGGATQKYVTTDLGTANWLDDGVTQASTGVDVYQPEEGTRFWWERRYRAVRSINDTDYFDGTATPWQFADGDWKTGTTGAYNGDITTSGLCVSTCDYSGNAAFQQEVTDTNWGVSENAWYHFTYDESVEGWGSNFHGFRWPLRAEMETRTSVRADYPIEIRFTGSGTGSIDVTSNAGVTVAGRLESRGGSVTMNVTDQSGIVGYDSALISAVDADLNSIGDIGSDGAPLRVSLDGGVLNANSSAGAVNIVSPAGELRIGSVSAAGAVRLGTDQSLLGTGSAVNVEGTLVELTAQGGAIGHENGGAMKVHASERLDATALDDIAVTQPDGNVYLGNLISLDGDISVTAEDGNIVSATNLDVSDLISLDELRQRWAESGITGDEAADDGDAAIEAFESMVEREYHRYWQFAQALESTGSGSLELSDAGARLYSGLAAANGQSVFEYVVGEYQRLDGFFKELLGTTELSGAEGFSDFDTNWQYAASAARQADFRNGAIWNEKRLENAINAAAVSSGAGVSWLDDSLNISARDVTLRASGDIGSFGTHEFRIAPETTITDQQRRWLLATAPGGLLIEQAADDADAVDIDVRTLSRLRVSARGELDVQAGTGGTARDIFIGADNDARVERLDADGEVYLGAQNDITYTETGQTIKGASEGLTLRAVGGDILGFDGEDFKLAIDGTLTAAIGSGSVHLRDVGGAAGLDVGILYAQDDLAVHVPGDLRQVQGRGFTIGARSLWLDIGGDAGAIGDATTGFAGPLNIAMHGLGDEAEAGLDGSVYGHIGGDLRFNADAQGVRLGGADVAADDGSTIERKLAVDGSLTLISGGDVIVANDLDIGTGAALQSSGDLLLDGPFSLAATTGDVSLIGTSLTMGEGSDVTAAAGRINVGTTGDALLTLLDSGLADDGTAAPAITVTAGGSVLSASTTPAPNLRSAAPQGVSVEAGIDIGGADVPLVIAGSGLLEASAGRDIHILALDVVTGGNVVATDGLIDLAIDGSAILASLMAGASIDVDAGGDLTVTTAVSELDQRYDAGGELRLGTVVARDGGIETLAGGSMNLASITTGKDQLHVADGKVTAGTLLSTAGDVYVDSKGAIDVTEVTAAVDIELDAASNLSIGDAMAGRDMRLNTGAVLIADSLESQGGGIDAMSANDLTVTTATSELDQRYDAGGDLRLGTIIARNGGIETLAGGSMELASITTSKSQRHIADGNFTAGTLRSTAGDVRVDSKGAIDVTEVTAAVDVELDAAADLSIGDAMAGRDMRLDTGASLTLNGLDAGRDITTESVGDTLGGPVVAGRNLRVAAGFDEALPVALSDIGLHSVTAEAVDLQASDDIRVLSRSGEESPGGFVDTTTTATFTAGGDIDISSVTAGDDVIASGSMLSFGTIDSGADVTLDAVEDIMVAYVDSDGFQNHIARGAFEFERLDAGGSIDSMSGGNTIGSSVRSDAPVTMTAGMRWLQSGETSGEVSEAGDLLLDFVEAPEARLRSGGETRIGQTLATRVAKFWGRTIRSSIRDTDDGQLNMSFAGGNEGLADTVGLDVRTNGDISFDMAYARDARIDTNSDRVTIDDGWVSELLRMQTQNTELLMNQLDPTARPVDVQLLELDQRFSLAIDGVDIFTDAYIEHYRAGHRVEVPNFQLDHGTMGLEVAGESAERNVTRAVMEGRDLPSFGMSRLKPPTAPLQAPPVSSLDGGVPVNFGADEGQTSGESSDDDEDDDARNV